MSRCWTWHRQSHRCPVSVPSSQPAGLSTRSTAAGGGGRGWGREGAQQTYPVGRVSTRRPTLPVLAGGAVVCHHNLLVERGIPRHDSDRRSRPVHKIGRFESDTPFAADRCLQGIAEEDVDVNDRTPSMRVSDLASNPDPSSREPHGKSIPKVQLQVPALGRSLLFVLG